MKSLEIESLRISLKLIFLRHGSRLGLHVGNHSWPTPLTTHYNFLFLLVGWAAELGPGSYPDFLSYFSLWGFSAGFFWPPSNHCVLLVVAQLSLFS